MIRFENFQPIGEKESSEKISVEVLSDGDVNIISCPTEELLEETIKKIGEAFNTPPHEQKELIQTIKQNGDWRFESCFNLKLRRDNKLVLDNRNGRGLEEYRKTLKNVIDSL